MTNLTFLNSYRSALVMTFAVLALIPLGQVNAAPNSTGSSGDEARLSRDTGYAEVGTEVGTIPAARPGLPQKTVGAEGPLRTDKRGSDPSVRDTNPLTVNGLWETQPGNLVTKPSPQ